MPRLCGSMEKIATLCWRLQADCMSIWRCCMVRLNLCSVSTVINLILARTWVLLLMLMQASDFLFLRLINNFVHSHVMAIISCLLYFSFPPIIYSMCSLPIPHLPILAMGCVIICDINIKPVLTILTNWTSQVINLPPWISWSLTTKTRGHCSKSVYEVHWVFSHQNHLNCKKLAVQLCWWGCSWYQGDMRHLSSHILI